MSCALFEKEAAEGLDTRLQERSVEWYIDNGIEDEKSATRSVLWQGKTCRGRSKKYGSQETT